MSDINPYAPPEALLEGSGDQSGDPPEGRLVLADRGTRLGAALLDGLIQGLPALALLLLAWPVLGSDLLT
jgi:hypothetical protein